MLGTIICDVIKLKIVTSNIWCVLKLNEDANISSYENYTSLINEFQNKSIKFTRKFSMK